MAVVEGSTLTAAELVALVEADSLTVDAGLELLDADDNLIEDITSDFLADGSTIERGIYRTVHGTARLRVSRELVWGSQRLRPYLLLSSTYPPRDAFTPTLLTESGEVMLTEGGDPILGVETRPASPATFYRWNLGVFLMSTPERVVQESPPVWDVDCFDKLDVLNTPYGSTYSLAAGENVVEAVEAIIAAAGESKVNIEPSDAVTASVRVLSIVDNLTTLQVCNDLLDSIGHRSLWVDRDGFYRAEPYVSPTDLPIMWSYSADSATTTVGESRRSSADFYQAANVVVGYNDDPDQDTIPTEGDGIYTLTNQSDGETSVDGRGGRIIRRVISGPYVDQAALATAVERIMDNEKRVAVYADITVGVNPAHGHYDVVNLRDDAVPINGRYLVTNWTLPLDGSDMALTLRGV